jgi:ADP-ribosyl-[dinitrogen reductase] hydrolase
MPSSLAKNILLGLAVGDALGVPAEFKSRETLKKNPVTAMTGYGTHNQSPGTWSDDSSLAFCLAESLCEGYNLKDIADRFIKWYDEAYWTHHGEVFDIGTATRKAIQRLKEGIDPRLAGGNTEYDNGNGSLMRIMPLLVLTDYSTTTEAYRLTEEVSSITHRHPRSVLACNYLLFLASHLTEMDVEMALMYAQGDINNFLQFNPEFKAEKHHFSRTIFDHRENTQQFLNPYEFIRQIPEHEIQSSGYVVHTLEASIWCLATTGNYKDAVLKAVNLGEDTDTTAAVTGALAGIVYGYESIPTEWIEQLARKDDIIHLAERLEKFHLEHNYKHRCPVCNVHLIYKERYPRYVCNDCVEKATDKDGRPLRFYNQSISGGFAAEYADTREPYKGHDCYIDGIACYADEARFGGIVVEKKV